MNIWGIGVKDVQKFFVLFLQLFSPKSEIIQKLKAFQKNQEKLQCSSHACSGVEGAQREEEGERSEVRS